MALWDDHVQGRYTKEVDLLSNVYNKAKLVCLIWAETKEQHIYETQTGHFKFFLNDSIFALRSRPRWGFQFHPMAQIRGSSEWEASEAVQPKFCDQQSSKMFVKSHFMHAVICWAMGLSKNNSSHFHLAKGMWNIDCVICHVNTKLQIKHWSTCQEENSTIYIYIYIYINK